MSLVNSPIQPLSDPLFEGKEITVAIKRDDLLHPEVMGNKWRKLKYNLLHVKNKGYKGMVTLGGAFSNHIAATAAACQENGLSSVGIIRGDELTPQSNYTLRFAREKGMQLEFVDRITYRQLREAPQKLEKNYPEYWILPEGGTNHLAIQGCQELITELPEVYDYVIAPIGTGGTLCGLLKGMEGKGTLIGISSLKGNFVRKAFEELCEAQEVHYTNYLINNDFHFGGYGRVPPELIRFINQTSKVNGLLFDPIYTGKMFFGVKELVNRSFFPPGSKILVIHTGGLQGIMGYNEINEKKILI